MTSERRNGVSVYLNNSMIYISSAIEAATLFFEIFQCLNGKIDNQRILLFARRIIYLCLPFLLLPGFSTGQTETFAKGAFIINMGVTPQTEKNALKPYGLIYDLIKNNKVEIKWSINPSKSKDGEDFAHNGISYKGGTFIIPVDFRTPAVNAKINAWMQQGVVGATTVAPITVPIHPVYGTLRNVPRWTLDKKNGKIAVEYFLNAGIPPDAFGGTSGAGWKDPSQLQCCDDLFVLPHAEPSWAVHQRLFSWNIECKGGLWDGCTSGSAIENMVNPSNRDQQTNFLTVKDAAFKGTSGIYANSNTLMLWGTHKDGSPPYTHRLPADPVAQYIGATDGAHTNGAEQIYIPRQTAGTTARWNPTTRIIAYDPTQQDVPSLNPDLRNAAAVMVYGRGFGDENRGYVMHSSGHSYDKCQSSPAHVAAQRAFFNFSWLVAMDKAKVVQIVNNGSNTVSSGVGRGISFTLPSGNLSDYTIEWTSTCGGTFTPNPAQQTLQFIPPPATDISGCILSVTLTDACGRSTTSSQKIDVFCDYNANFTTTNPSCKSSANGKINITLTGTSVYGSNTWNWTRESPQGSGSGSGNEINSLQSGTYKVTVTSFTGCTATFTALLTEPNDLDITSAVKSYECYGQTGYINLNVGGGTAGYSYIWNDGTTNKNRTGITLGNYTVTVTDTKGCSKTASYAITGPAIPFGVSLTKTDATCFGYSNGTINVTTSGGNGTYYYNWSDAQSLKDRTDLPAGKYSVTVTDSDGCSAGANITVGQPLALNADIQTSRPDCPPDSNPPLSQNGAITLTTSGGTTPYNYLWNTGQTTKDRSNLAHGTYTVTITDAKGCQLTRTIMLTAISAKPSPPTVIK
jgi:hypothetical protein